MSIFISKKLTISDLIKEQDNIQFIIPTYQRPYVWGDEEIKKLLDDVFNSFEDREDSIYFIGNVYVTKSSNNKYDVVDGQQRFTTLWLIAAAFAKQDLVSHELTSFLKFESELRLSFSIRTEVESYLNKILINGVHKSDEKNESVFIEHISAGIKTIIGFLDQIEDEKLDHFATYIYEKVTFIYNIAPANTNLNGLFTALGNSGVQLEQTDILKARLLKKMDNRLLYSKIWEACENMNNYFENNVKSIFSATDWEIVTEEMFSSYDENVFTFVKDSSDSGGEVNSKTILEIIKSEYSEQGTTENKKDAKMRCKSVIPFSLLLLHTYRIFRNKNSEEDFQHLFDKKKLLDNFQDTVKMDKTELECFFKLLWQVRYVFDRYIVKWRFDNEENLTESDEVEKLRLTSFTIAKNDKSFTRQNRAHSKLSMLQSVLYFTGGYNQQYWLTPFLKFLLNDDQDDEAILKELEKIDNLMLPGEKKTISWHLLDSEYNHKNIENLRSIIGENKGTHFNHYWFYKLEYLLWKKWNENSIIFDDMMVSKYRITSKNSIEHISPQNLKEEEKYEHDLLHDFGNLALLSIGQNSSYSNKDVNVKSTEFRGKKTYESLKLARVYTSNEIKWNEVDIANHREEMLSILEEHYYQNSKEFLRI
jgi:uncharacterized protein with ParB-like and HNH nuclease domain